MGIHMGSTPVQATLTANDATLWARLNGMFWAAFLLISMTTASIVYGTVIERIRPSAFLTLAVLIGSVLWILGAARGWHPDGWMVKKLGYGDAFWTYSGGLAGVIGASAGNDLYHPIQALHVGAIGALIIYKLRHWVERWFKLDDAVGAVAVHGYTGFYGCPVAGYPLWGYRLRRTAATPRSTRSAIASARCPGDLSPRAHCTVVW